MEGHISSVLRLEAWRIQSTTLQMRYKRLLNRLSLSAEGVCSPSPPPRCELGYLSRTKQIKLFKEAKEHIEKSKWELASKRMLEIGFKKKPGSMCERLWNVICVPAHQRSTVARIGPQLC